jgi:hypothetical protein
MENKTINIILTVILLISIFFLIYNTYLIFNYKTDSSSIKTCPKDSYNIYVARTGLDIHMTPKGDITIKPSYYPLK